MVVTAEWFEENGDWYLPAWMFDEDGVLLRDPEDDDDEDELYVRS